MKLETGIMNKDLISAEQEVSSVQTSEVATKLATSFHHEAYHELKDQPVQQMDLLASIESNMKLLEDLQSRQSFMSREIRYLLKLS